MVTAVAVSRRFHVFGKALRLQEEGLQARLLDLGKDVSVQLHEEEREHVDVLLDVLQVDQAAGVPGRPLLASTVISTLATASVMRVFMQPKGPTAMVPQYLSARW
jgi:hypothetical protein